MQDGRIYVAEITVVVDANGTEQTFYFSTAPFATSPSDTPANTPILPLLKNPGNMSYDLFSQGRLTGLVQPNFGVMTLANPYDDNGKGVLDDWITYGVSNGKVVLRIGEIGAAYPAQWTTVYIARVYKINVNEEVQITLRDRSQLLDKPVVTDVFLGTGGPEGNGPANGRKKQQIFGDPGYIPPILVDAQKQIYFVSANGDGGAFNYFGFTDLFDVFDNGIRLARTLSTYSTYEEMEANSPMPGFARFYTGDFSRVTGWRNGPIYMRLGSPPAGELRVFAQGYPDERDFVVDDTTVGSFNHVPYLLYRAGFNPDDIDFSTEGFGTPLGAILVEDDKTFLQVLSEGALIQQSWFGFNRVDKFRCGQLLDPEDKDPLYGIEGFERPPIPTVSKYTFTEDKYKSLKSEPIPGQEIPIWSITVNSGRTWPVKELAGGTENIIRDYLSRDPWWSSFTAYSDETKIKNPNSVSEEIVIPSRDLVNDLSVRVYSGRYFHLYGGNPRTYTLTTEMNDETLSLDLHDVVTLQSPRFNLQNGVKMRIVGIRIDCQRRTMQFSLWVPGRANFSGFTSVLQPGSTAYNQNQITKANLSKIGKVRLPTLRLSANANMSLGNGAERMTVRLPGFNVIVAGTMTPPLPDPNWATRSLGSSGSTNLRNLLFAYNGTRLVLSTYEVSGPNYARIFYSDDQGETWSVVTTLVNTNTGSIAHNGTAFVLHANGNTCLRSTDGLSWSTITLPGSDHTRITAVGSTFIITSDSTRPHRSTDNGLTFSAVNTFPMGVSFFTTTGAFGTSSKMVVCGQGSGGTGAVWVSSDNGLNWTRTTTGLPWGGGNPPLSLAYSPVSDRFVATNNNIYYSTDGVSWTAVSTPDFSARNVIYGNGLFVAFDQTQDNIAYSYDGITWTIRNSDLPGGAYSMISVAPNRLVAVDFSTSLSSVSVGTY